MVVLWDFTLVKAYDEDFVHGFPEVLTGCIFQTVKHRYLDREFVHIIRKDVSESYSMHGLSFSYTTTWGGTCPANHAASSRVYRECAEEHGSWIDTESHILYYTHGSSASHEYVYQGMCYIFAGSNPIPRTVRCSQQMFVQFAMRIRTNYIKIVCDSATVCFVDNGYIRSTHKVSTV